QGRARAAVVHALAVGRTPDRDREVEALERHVERRDEVALAHEQCAVWGDAHVIDERRRRIASKCEDLRIHRVLALLDHRARHDAKANDIATSVSALPLVTPDDML